MDHKIPSMATLTDARTGKPIQVDIENIKKKTHQNYTSAGSKAWAHSSFVTTLHNERQSQDKSGR